MGFYAARVQGELPTVPMLVAKLPSHQRQGPCALEDKQAGLPLEEGKKQEEGEKSTVLQPVVKTMAGPSTRAGFRAAPVMCPAASQQAIHTQHHTHSKWLDASAEDPLWSDGR
jgi:hypothetical protein